MMFDIYGNASKVCIWLGEANDSSCLALRFIENEVLHLQDFDRLCEQNDASAKWSALLELMQRPWVCLPELDNVPQTNRSEVL
jgi:hypothetical protein